MKIGDVIHETRMRFDKVIRKRNSRTCHVTNSISVVGGEGVIVIIVVVVVHDNDDDNDNGEYC